MIDFIKDKNTATDMLAEFIQHLAKTDSVLGGKVDKR
jgi:hypothetical protein